LSRSFCGSFLSDAETLHRSVEHVEHRRDRQLHRGRVAAGVADAALPGVLAAREFRQAVVPAGIEAVVGGEVDDHRSLPCRKARVERVHAQRRLAVGQCQHHRIGAKLRQLLVRRRAEAQVAVVVGTVVGQALAGEFAR